MFFFEKLYEKFKPKKSNKMNEELHHKMCKKVAQLTRVIFFLNTKNDEYEQNLKVIFHSKNI